MNLLGRCVAALLLALAMAAAVASPVTIDQTTEAETNPEPALAASAPGGLRAWIRSEATGTFLQQQIEQDRLAVASEPYTPPAPTWIQGAANVNPADYPTLDRSVETAERDLRTIEWVLQERERLARQAHDGSATEPAGPNWIRALMPSNWLPVLKAYREWIVGGAGLVLGVAWMLSMFSRRPSATPSPATVAKDPRGDAPRVHRRRRRHRSSLVT